jgi:4-hydroxybenzoate polyprenyltransferase
VGKTYIWGVAIIAGTIGVFLTAMVFGLLSAAILTLIMTPALVAALTVFHRAHVARREQKIIKKIVDTAMTGEGRPGNDTAMKHAAE